MTEKKPLELTIWPHWEDGLDGTCYADKNDRARPVNVDFEIYRKRLQDYQLAAEYWRAGDDMAETNYDRDVNAEPIRRILERFAISPHASESDYQ
jgi:hypothetical protein